MTYKKWYPNNDDLNSHDTRQYRTVLNAVNLRNIYFKY